MVASLEPAVAVAVKTSASVQHGSLPGEAWHARLGPQISAELSLNSHWTLWLALPGVVEIGVGEKAGVTSVGGIGDFRVGSGYSATFGALALRFGVGISIPTGVGSLYGVRVAGYSSGSGEYLFQPAAGIAYVWDPVAVRFQTELDIGPSDRAQAGMFLSKIHTAVSALLLLNRRFALEGGVGLQLDRESLPGGASIPVPLLRGEVGFTSMFGDLSATVSISSGLWPYLESVMASAALGVSWRRT